MWISLRITRIGPIHPIHSIIYHRPGLMAEEEGIGLVVAVTLLVAFPVPTANNDGT